MKARIQLKQRALERTMKEEIRRKKPVGFEEHERVTYRDAERKNDISGVVNDAFFVAFMFFLFVYKMSALVLMFFEIFLNSTKLLNNQCPLYLCVTTRPSNAISFAICFVFTGSVHYHKNKRDFFINRVL
eukprot:GEMP01055252.1.p1 GENE.GEMP01055252.1~~GEMP01055252.1.p1  ORF type:complete len:130 (-),score=15.05 GEMP01055252.1:997-1386(-)